MSIDELRWENAHLQEELAELREELGLHCAGYEHRIQRRRELLAEIERLNAELGSSRAHRQRLSAALADVRLQLAELRDAGITERTRLRNQLKDARARLQHLEDARARTGKQHTANHDGCAPPPANMTDPDDLDTRKPATAPTTTTSVADGPLTAECPTYSPGGWSVVITLTPNYSLAAAAI